MSSLPSHLLNAVASPVIVADSVLEDACVHLEYLGYRIERGSVKDWLFASHVTHLSWWLRDLAGGLLFRKAYSASESGRAKREALVDLANRMNTNGIWVRCFIDDRHDLALEAWYPSLYERRSFGHFLMALDSEVRGHLRRWPEEVEALLT